MQENERKRRSLIFILFRQIMRCDKEEGERTIKNLLVPSIFPYLGSE